MDRALVVRAQGGDQAAFAGLLDGDGGRLLAIADGILRDRGLAEDATQRALLTIWRDLPGLRDPDRYEAWSYRVLVRTCYAEARRARGWLPNVLSPVTVDGTAYDPLGNVVDRDQLERAFRRLSVEQRAVIVLHHYLELPRPEIAEALGVPLGTVHSRLRNAMAALRAALDADARPGPADSAAVQATR
jgi:RNA polymerase sigma-70 factor (ECF subfamily)